MAIKAGDVVYEFLGDLSNLDESFDKAKETGEKWQDEVKGLSQEQADAQSRLWSEPAKAAEDAGKKVVEVAASTAASATSATAQAVAATAQAATGTAAVTSSVTELSLAAQVLPGVFAGAFGVAVVLGFLEVLGAGLSAFYAWQTSTLEFAASWEKVQRTFFETDQSLQNGIDKEKQKLIELTQGPVAALEFGLKHMGDGGVDAFKALDREMQAVLKDLDLLTSGFIGKLDVFVGSGGIATEDIKESMATLSKLMREAAAERPGDPTAALAKGLDFTTQKIIGMNVAIGGVDKALDNTFSQGAATKGLEAEREGWIAVTSSIQKQIETLQLHGKVLQQEEAKKAADQAAGIAKGAMEQQLAQIELWKATQHQAYEEGKVSAADWGVAQVRAAQAAAIAHEDYQQRLITIYARSGQVIKAQAAQQELATLATKNQAKETEVLAAAMEKHRTATQKVIQEYATLLSGAINKESQAAINLLNERVKAQQAAIDGEVQAEQAAADQKAIILKTQYDRGLITAQQYLEQLKKLYADEVQALVAMLNRKQQLVIIEAQNEARRRGQTLTDAQAKELKGYQDIENKKAAIQADFDKKFLKTQDQVTTRQAKQYQTIGKLLDDYAKKLRASHTELTGFGKAAEATLNGVTDAFGSAISAWLSGQASFGQAMEQALAQYLIQVASKAAIDALYFTAWGIADLFWNPARAGADFAAAGEFAAIAGVAGAAGKALAGASSGGGSKDSKDSTGTASGAANPATQPAQNPVTVQNTARLAEGGLVTRATAIVAGDARGGGDAAEGVLPLTNPRAMRAIAAAITDHMGGAGGDHYHIKGDVIDHTQLIRRVSRQVKRGKGRLTSANSLRLTRRS